MVMDIRLVRIDDRLIHGQVATVWSKATGVERIIVVSDVVAYDDLQKFLLKQAAPPGIKSNVVTIRKMIDVYHDQLFDGMKVMLLFTSPKDVLRVVNAGIELSTVNVGGMRFSEGKKMITNFISVDDEDIATFLQLADHGIELETRKVPTDRKNNLLDALGKERKIQ